MSCVVGKKNVVVSLKDNPNHAPAGSPEGGQFTSGAGGHAITAPTEAELLGGARNLDELAKSPAHMAMAQQIKALNGSTPFISPEAPLLGEMKAQVSKDLAATLKDDAKWNGLVAASGLSSEQLADKFVGAWAQTSGSNSQAAFFQAVVEKEFDLKDLAKTGGKTGTLKEKSIEQLATLAIAKNWGGKAGGVSPEALIGGSRSLARGMYENTQKLLKEQGIKEVYLVRGVHGLDLDAGTQSVQLRALSSFSSSRGKAEEFAMDKVVKGEFLRGMVAYAKVPASRIFSTPKTGLGCVREAEMVVLGGKSRAVIADNGAGRADFDGFNMIHFMNQALAKVKP